MTVDTQQRPRQRKKLWLAAGLAALVLALVVVPPLIGISRYKNRITQLVSSALGRPVRLSGVELRLLPRPGFLLSDLTVEEDPAYGFEPVLHATTVVASIRFTSLWRGKLQISRISVDDASLNLVRAGDGHWNIDSLFRSAAAGSGHSGAVFHPYLEATDSRINIKNGLEKLPFSLLNADASLWQESDGEWRVRLVGQPARTDVSLELADTGIVRLDGTMRPASQFSQMPFHLDAEWRRAQLGQLSRLLLGSDEGWRGDLSGELHLDGTAASAHVQASLRAFGVHREEFAPAVPLDFDAACTFVFQYSNRSVEDLDCSSPVGDGRAHLTGSIPRAGQPARLSLDLSRIPAQAGLDLLRTVRSNVDASLEVAGTLSGHLHYDAGAAAEPSTAPPGKAGVHAIGSRPSSGPLAGGLTLEGFSISGDSLPRPIAVARVNLEPAPLEQEDHAALVTSFSLPAGGPVPLTVHARLSLAGFQLGLRGPVSIARLREFTQFAGAAADPALGHLGGEPASIDLSASGPWVPPVQVTLGAAAAPWVSSVHASGTITFRDANWKPSFLANALLIHQAILRLNNDALRWDPVDFSYGPVKGSATLEVPLACTTPADCAPQFSAHFAALDTAEMRSALLGTGEKGTLLSSLLDRLNLSSLPQWPAAGGSVEVDSLTLGPFVLTGLSADVKIAGTGAELTTFEASTLGGTLKGSAMLQAANKPQYTIVADFAGLKPALLGGLLGMRWSGESLGGSGKLEMTGFTGKDLAASADGTVQFDWRKGSIRGAGIPLLLTGFDRFSGEAAIANGTLSVSQDKVQHGAKSTTAHAALTLAVPHKVTFSAARR